MTWNTAYYEEQQGRVRGLLITIETQLPPASVELFHELVDANESGAVLTLVANHPFVLTDDQAHDLWELATSMALDPDVLNRLTVLCRRPTPPRPGPVEAPRTG